MANDKNQEFLNQQKILEDEYHKIEEANENINIEYQKLQ